MKSESVFIAEFVSDFLKANPVAVEHNLHAEFLEFIAMSIEPLITNKDLNAVKRLLTLAEATCGIDTSLPRAVRVQLLGTVRDEPWQAFYLLLDTFDTESPF